MPVHQHKYKAQYLILKVDLERSVVVASELFLHDSFHFPVSCSVLVGSDCGRFLCLNVAPGSSSGGYQDGQGSHNELEKGNLSDSVMISTHIFRSGLQPPAHNVTIPHTSQHR